MRRKKSDESGGPSWLDTYADMVTLLLTFFILLFAMSSMSEAKWQLIVKAFGQQPDKPYLVQPPDGAGGNTFEIPDPPYAPLEGSEADSPADVLQPPAVNQPNIPMGPVERVKNFDDLYPYLKQYIDNNKLQSEVVLMRGDGYTFIAFRDNVFFDGNSSVLRESGKPILTYIAEAFRDISDQIGLVRIDGHTARVSNDPNKPNGTRFDRELSTNRAVSVLWYLESFGTVSGAKLMAVGHGDYHPIAPYDGTEQTREKNRRAEIFISRSASPVITLEELYETVGSSASP